MPISANIREYGEHVPDSAADRAALRDFRRFCETATADELAKLSTRDGCLRYLGVPPLSNHKKLTERFGDRERAYVAWKCYRSMNSRLGPKTAITDKWVRAVAAVTEVLSDPSLDPQQVLDVLGGSLPITWTDSGGQERQGDAASPRFGLFKAHRYGRPGPDGMTWTAMTDFVHDFDPMALEAQMEADGFGAARPKTSSHSKGPTAKEVKGSLLAACKQPLRLRPTGEGLLRRFGLRGIQFGNCSSSDARKVTEEQALFLCCLEEALADLASVTGLPDAAMGQVMRSVAWAARGKPGTAGHYEGRGPEANVVNLTRAHGAEGVLAHEWGHALDYFLGWAYLGRARAAYSESCPYAGDPAHPAASAFAQWLRDGSTAFSKQARKADSGKRRYHAKASEKFARAFEGWVARQGAAGPVPSLFLVSRAPALVPDGCEATCAAQLISAMLNELAASGALTAPVEEPAPEPSPVAAKRPAPREGTAWTPGAGWEGGIQMSLF